MFSVLCFICPQQILMYSDSVDRRGIHPKVSFYFFGVDYAGRLRLAELSRTGLWLQHISETSWERCSSRYLIPTSISSTIILTRQAWPQSRKARYSTKCKTVVATTAWGSGSPDIDWAHLIFVVSACHPYLYMPFLTLWILYEFLPACAAAFAFD